MTESDHIQRHIKLHHMLDELIADWILHTDKRPSTSTVSELMVWAYSQTKTPTGIGNHD